MSRVVWVGHPRHLPKAPAGRTVVLDVAFAAGTTWKSKTKPFLDALGERLLRYVDHHEHKEAWPLYAHDPRFVLVPNKIAHACPELVTPELVNSTGPVDAVVAHADLDGAVAAAKWLCGGREPWPGADEDARAVDSPGRGHTLSARGAQLAWALDEASARFDRKTEHALLTRVVDALVSGERSLGFDDEIETLASAARAAEERDNALGAQRGALEAPGVFVVRMDKKPDNRTRRNLLLFAEERAPVGALFEPDPAGGAWLIAATFDQSLDLEDVHGFEGGRSDYRFARAHDDGSALVQALSAYVRSKAPPS